MGTIINAHGYLENGQFSGAESVTLTSGSGFENATTTYGGLYVGLVGNLTAKTIDGSVVTFVSASGFIPGIFTAVSGSSTCGAIIGLK